MLWVPIVVGGLAAGLSLALLAYAPRMGYTLRDATDAEAERLHRLRDDVDLPDVETAVRTTTRDSAVECVLVGLPGRRTLIVTDAALDSLNDEQLRALLAVETERGRARIETIQALSAGLGVGVVATTYVALLPTLPALFGGWTIVLAGIALARRLHYAADEAAAVLVGPEVLRETMTEAAELRGDSLDSGSWWRALLEVEPSVGTRIERLEPGEAADE